MNLDIIYSCYWGGYLAVVAASLHLGLINDNEFTLEKVLGLPFFGKIDKDNLGQLKYLGSDEKASRVFVLGNRKSGDIIERALNGTAEIYEINKKIILVNLVKCHNIYLTIGCFFRQKLKSKLALFLIYKGVKMELYNIKQEVDKVKEDRT